MSLMKRTAFLTDDGKLFLDENQAEKHQAQFEFDSWYTKNRLCATGTCAAVNLDHMKDWLKNNREIILKFFEGESEK